ncbi:MAG: hypothetical protein II792_05875 [Prevotella sp.]|nr:hypothetical protein [Prevotella sp.]
MREGWCRLPSKNIDFVVREGLKFSVPTGIGTNTEHMQNLAELLYAMSHSLHRERNVRENAAPGLFSKGLRMFHDFSHKPDKLQYHNHFFFQRVCDAWKALGLFSAIFGFDDTDPRYVDRHATGKELATTGKCSHKEYIEDTYTFFLDGKEYKPQPE